MNFDLQLFTEDALKYQTPNQLRKGIRSLKKKINLHLAKIENPDKFCKEWASYDEGQREGLLWHWQHEIGNFEKSIQYRIDELAKRGEQP